MHEQLIQPKAETESVSKSLTLFKPIAWQTKIDFINHLVLFNNILIAVLAEQKGGKTSFIQILMQHLDSQVKACVITAPIPCDHNTLVCNIADAFHLKNDGDQPIDMASVVRQINERKAIVLLIIDNAQNLPEAWIQEVLSEIQQQGDNAYFHVCLFSDFSVVVSYNEITKDIGHHRIHSIELGALNENEMKIYVANKVAINNVIYTNEQLNQLYKKTGGCLAKINKHLLVHQPNENKLIVEKKTSFVKQLYTSAAITTIAVGVAFYYSKNEFTNSPKINQPIVQKAHQTKLNLPEIKQEPILVSELPNWQQGTREFMYSALPKKQILAVLDGNDFETISIVNQPIIEKRATAPKIKIKKIINISNKGEYSYIEPIAKKALTVTSSYTIQLLASHQLVDLHRFIAQYNLQSRCSIRMAGSKNDSWYILTLGEYTTSAQANLAAGKLSSDISKYKPWVRLTNNLKTIVG